MHQLEASCSFGDSIDDQTVNLDHEAIKVVHLGYYR
jgi:hypothetical protein